MNCDTVLWPELYNIDCMELMAMYPDKFFDLAIIDPPYGLGEDGSKYRSRIGRGTKQRNGDVHVVRKSAYADIQSAWDDSPPSKDYFIELFRVSKNQIIWGANHFIANIPNSNSPCWIVWDKVNGASHYADCELAWTSYKTAVRQFRFMWQGMFQGKSIEEGHIQQGNKRLNEPRIHPTQKPVALYKWLLSKYAEPGMRILDTHLGSASIALACMDMGYALTACELNKSYFELALSRVTAHYSKLINHQTSL